MYKGAEKKLQEVEHSSKQAVRKLLYSLLEIVSLCNNDFKKHKGLLKHETETSVRLLKIGQVGRGTETLTAYKKVGAHFRERALQGAGWGLEVIVVLMLNILCQSKDKGTVGFCLYRKHFNIWKAGFISSAVSCSRSFVFSILCCEFSRTEHINSVWW